MFKWSLVTLLIFLGCGYFYRIEPIYSFDVMVTLFFESIRTPLLTSFFIFMSNIGSIKYMLPICIVFAIYLLLKKRIISVIFLFTMLITVRKLNELIKEIYQRERPSFDPVYEAAFYSFPSGHAMNSISVYSFLCSLAICQFAKGSLKRKALILFTSSLVFLIGISRIYLGVHFFTDVLGGFSLGFTWFIIVTTILDKINGRFDKTRCD